MVLHLHCDEASCCGRTTATAQDIGAGGEATLTRHEKASSRYQGALSTLIPVRRTR